MSLIIWLKLCDVNTVSFLSERTLQRPIIVNLMHNMKHSQQHTISRHNKAHSSAYNSIYRNNRLSEAQKKKQFKQAQTRAKHTI